MRVLRNERRYLNPNPNLMIEEGDVLLVQGPSDEVLKIKTTNGVKIRADEKYAENGAAVVLIPIALQTAGQLHLNPRPFAIMIAIAVSCTYLTPLEPSNLMVYGPGRYRFLDFPKVGLPLILLIFIISMLLVPLLWPL